MKDLVHLETQGKVNQLKIPLKVFSIDQVQNKPKKAYSLHAHIYTKHIKTYPHLELFHKLL